MAGDDRPLDLRQDGVLEADHAREGGQASDRGGRADWCATPPSRSGRTAPPARSSPRVVGAGEGVAGLAGSVTSTTVRRSCRALRSLCKGWIASRLARIGLPLSAPLVTGADVRGRPRTARGVVRRTPIRQSRPLADRVGGRPGSSARTSSGPVRSRSAAPTPASRGCPEPSGRRRRRGQRRQPRAGRGAGGPAARGAGHGLHAPGAPMPKVAATRGYGAEVGSRATVDEALRAAA